MRKKSNYFEKRKIKTWIERLLITGMQVKTEARKIVRTVSKVSAGMCRAFQGKEHWEKMNLLIRQKIDYRKTAEGTWREMLNTQELF